MREMTGIERMTNFLKREPMDRVPIYEHFWNDTLKIWKERGQIDIQEDLDDHFDFDMSECWTFNMVADLDFEPVVVEETEETILKRDGNGALLRTHKLHASTPEHVDFMVKERAQWEEIIKPKLTPDPRRINFEAYRKVKAHAAEKNRFFCWSGVNVFELMHPVCGHEYMLMGMALDADWVKDMVNTYAELTVNLQEMLFEKEGKPDAIWYYEDMGYKLSPFMSFDMYKDIVQPGHKRTISYAKSQNLPVIMHSCGFIEPLLPGMVEAGIDALQVLEIKAGMDPMRVQKNFGDRLSIMGGIDVRTLYSNDYPTIEEELQKKLIPLMKNYGYSLHSDHSIPGTVDYKSYCHFLEKGREWGTYSG